MRSTAGEETPPGARKTIVAVSPACAGKRVLSRSVARWESEEGNPKLFEKAEPADPAAKPAAIRAKSQARIVALR